jgi:lysylphosphatidylglycerol synthetase-like protein (DUF2156 family)
MLDDMLKKLKSLVSFTVMFAFLIFPVLVFAGNPESPTEKLRQVGGDSGYNVTPTATSLPVTVGKVISSILSLLGVIFLALMVYAGFLWMIAAGNEDKVTRSKDTMRRAVIGLVIVVASYALSQFIVLTLTS